MPQPVSSQEDYFQVLGVARRFAQNKADLEARFYELSRLLHPDRFSASKPEWRMLSLARMSLVNQAYAALRNPASLRDYLLKQEAISASQAPIPSGLSEAWFEVQDLLFENPIEARLKLAEFEAELNTFKQETDKGIVSLELEYDQNSSVELLKKLSDQVQTLNYLNSMQRDVERIKKNAYSS